MIKRFTQILILLFVFGLIAPQVYAGSKSPNRVHKEFYDNGKMRLHLKFKNGLIARKRAYFRNGRLKLDFIYVNGLAVKMRNFYETGQLFSIWTKKSGVTKYYHRDGRIKAVVEMPSNQ